ncbi:uncharacterized protein LOC122293771 [Carya illinoinensis]|uniref:uncharacterized protein LOC122293771 n=1 Tax=Carya illinoinensis TaxID=32201 RepID=UPI001C71F9DE|nr:uncharacterized protein LOC122293771 [Carya illinoinensis]
MVTLYEYGRINGSHKKIPLRLEARNLDLVALVCYRIWQRRNDLIFKNNFQGLKALIKFAISEIEVLSIRQGEKLVRQGPVIPQATVSYWQPPPPTWLKVNFDASFNKSELVMGMDIIARDSNGDPHVMLATQKESVSSVFLAKAFALLRAFTLCAEMGIMRAEFKGDAKMVVEAIKDPNSNYAWHGQLIEDLKHVLETHPSWKLSYANRVNNKVAHELAKLALSIVNETIWREEGPDVVAPLISCDRLCSNEL